MPLPDSKTFTAPDGESITYWQWPSQPNRPTIHWAHATGFSGRTYAPLLDSLAERMNVLAWDMRGHGASGDSGRIETFRGWQSYYHDMSALLESFDEPIWLAGHSVGGMTTLAAAGMNADKVKGVILVEPVILDRNASIFLGAAKMLGRSGKFGLAAGAARRRPTFPSREDVFKNYREKKSFKSWPDHWLESYIDHGFVDADDEVRLACDPAYESLSFAHTEHRPFRHIAKLRDIPEIHILASERGSTFLPTARDVMKRKLPHAQIDVVPDSTHFLPMEHTDYVARWIEGIVLNR